jgi:hypothetical protein
MIEVIGHMKASHDRPLLEALIYKKNVREWNDNDCKKL